MTNIGASSDPARAVKKSVAPFPKANNVIPAKSGESFK